jgi:hypothetical protein
VEELEIGAQGRGRGSRTTIWLATRYGSGRVNE